MSINAPPVDDFMQKPISGEAWMRLLEKVSQQTSRFKARALLQTEAGTHTRPPRREVEDEVCVDSP
jgi:hypothetical protein